MARYHVALWRQWSDTSSVGYPWFPAVTEEVEATSPFLAVLHLMARSHLRFVRHAAVQADDTKVITRYDRVKLYADPVRESAPAPDECEGDA